MVRIVAIVERPDHVCYRYRIEAFQPFLAKRLGKLKPLVLAKRPVSFLRQLSRIARADAVVLQRRLLPSWKLRLLRHAAKQLIYDVDDAIFLRDNNSHKSAFSVRRLRRFEATVRAADVVTVGNFHLKEKATIVRSDTPIDYLPTCVQPGHYPLARHTRQHDLQLVWIGSQSTMSSLQSAEAGLQAAASRLPGLTLKVICDGLPNLSGVRQLLCQWSSATEAQEIAAADVGMSWLPDHPWSLGKCGLKVLQYMAAGLPVVANSIGVHKQLVQHGETGFLADTPEQWSTAISVLAKSPELRRSMGQAARARVEAEYSVDRWGPRFAQLVASLAGCYGEYLRAA